MEKNSTIFIAGSGGMAGSAILRELQKQDYTNILTPKRSELDLLNQVETQEFFEKNAIEYVFVAAARVGGIHANNIQPAQFIYENIIIESNIVHASYLSSVKQLMFLGSSCIYPRNADQPMAEDCLLTGSLEPTNEPYSIAKIAGIKLCESYNRQYGTDYRSLMPTNLYGQGDNFHLEHSHVIPALIHKFHIAKEQNKDSVVLWGSGSPRREFLHVDDLASACLYFMNMPREDFHSRVDQRVSQINIGTGVDIALVDLASLIKGIIGYEGEIIWDTSMPSGTPQKLLNVSRAESMGWKAKISLEDGLRQTYSWFLKNLDKIRR